MKSPTPNILAHLTPPGTCLSFAEMWQALRHGYAKEEIPQRVHDVMLVAADDIFDYVRELPAPLNGKYLSHCYFRLYEEAHLPGIIILGVYVTSDAAIKQQQPVVRVEFMHLIGALGQCRIGPRSLAKPTTKHLPLTATLQAVQQAKAIRYLPLLENVPVLLGIRFNYRTLQEIIAKSSDSAEAAVAALSIADHVLYHVQKFLLIYPEIVHLKFRITKGELSNQALLRVYLDKDEEWACFTYPGDHPMRATFTLKLTDAGLVSGITNQEIHLARSSFV